MSAQKPGIVFLVGAGPGDPGLITLRAVECLRQANVVVYDRLANRYLLNYAPHAEWIDAGKMPEHHKLPQERINQVLVEHASQGRVVVRLKGGDPFVFGRGGEEAAALAAAGIPFEIVPGISSAIAAPAYAGIPVTHRNLACSTAFITGHRSTTQDDGVGDWRCLANSTDTLVFLMGIHNLPRIVEQLLAGGRAAQTPVAIIAQGTRPGQQTITGTLADIVARAESIQPPAVIVVGEVVRLRSTLRWFDRPGQRPLLGLRVLNPRNLAGRGPDPLSALLLAAGAEPVELATSRLAALNDPGELDAALQRLVDPQARPEWLIFTSANTVHFTLERFIAVGYDLRALAGVKLAVIGKATGAALREWRLNADFTAGKATAAGLAAELSAAFDLRNKHLFVPRSSAALPELPALLAQASAHVETVTAYTLERVEPDPVALEQFLAGQIDAAAFLSPSALTSLADYLAEQDVSLPQALAASWVVCIGSTTAQAARKLGVRVDRIASTPSLEAVRDALSEARQPLGGDKHA